jgi:hypothetical protein
MKILLGSSKINVAYVNALLMLIFNILGISSIFTNVLIIIYG